MSACPAGLSHPHTPCPAVHRCTASMRHASADDAAQCWLTVGRTSDAAMAGVLRAVAACTREQPSHRYLDTSIRLESPSSLIRPLSRYHMMKFPYARHKPDQTLLCAAQGRPRRVPLLPTRSQDNLNSALRLVSSSSGACHRATGAPLPRAPIAVLRLYHCSPSDFLLRYDQYAQYRHPTRHIHPLPIHNCPLHSFYPHRQPPANSNLPTPPSNNPPAKSRA